MSRNEDIAAAVASGKRTLASVGKEYGITRERVRQICVTHGVTVRLGHEANRGPRPQKPERVAEIRRRVEAGETLTHIARAMHLNWGTVHRTIEINGIARPPKPTPKYVLARKLRATGLPLLDIAVRLDTSVNAICQMLYRKKKYGTDRLN